MHQWISATLAPLCLLGTSGRACYAFRPMTLILQTGRVLTIHSSRTRFAGRLNSSVRPHEATSLAIFKLCHRYGRSCRGSGSVSRCGAQAWLSWQPRSAVCMCCTSGGWLRSIHVLLLLRHEEMVFSNFCGSASCGGVTIRSTSPSVVCIRCDLSMRPNNSFKPNPLRGSA